MQRPRWSGYFQDFQFPYFFYSPSEYERWMPAAGLAPLRLELVQKDMQLNGGEGLAAWARTTWLRHTERVPEAEREEFLSECVGVYLKEHPLDAAGICHVRMMRLEYEAKLQE